MSKISKEQIDRIKTILDEQGELPQEWRWVLFPPERQEYELVYGGKQREEEIISQTMAVPLQNVRTFNNGPGMPNPDQWYNRLIFGDNLQAMKSLLNDPNVAGKVKLIYIDPPFATKKEFKGSKDQKAYQDKIAGAEFVEFLRKRLVFLKELMSPDGSIYVHLDYKKGHYIKIVLDEVFGEANFVNQIIWKRTSAHSDSKTLGNAHDIILHYGKTSNIAYNKQVSEYSENYIKKYYKHKDERGRFLDRDLTAKSLQGQGYEYEWNGINAIWRCPKETMQKYHDEAMLYYTKKGRPRLKQYLNEQKGRSLQDVWTDINVINSQAVERIDYPTQKPETLLERIILSSSNENDIILDAFAGSGTTCAVAEKLKRKWIAIDCGKLAIYTIQKRMLSLHADIGNKGRKIKAKPFLLQNAGLYDFASLQDLPWEDWRFFALQLFECKDKKHKIGSLEVDGLKGTAPVLVYDWKTHKGEQISEETIDDIHSMIGKKIGKKFYVIAPMMAFDFFQDYIDKDGVRYYALRIPYNVIKELHSRDFQAVLQARDEGNVNDIQEAYGFSFMIAPEVEWEVKTKKPKGQLFNVATLKTKKFKSRAWIKGEAQKGEKETLTMLMVDLNYDGAVFDLDKAFYGEELEENDWEAFFSPEEMGEKIMAVWIDHHGNESKAVITRKQFGLSKTTTKAIKKKIAKEKTAKKTVIKKATKKKTAKKATKKKAAKKKTSRRK